MNQRQLLEVSDFIDELRYFINNTEYIEYPAEIRKMLIDYDIEKQVLREQSHSLIADALGSTKKIEKLLGIIAVLDLSDTIKSKHLKFAIEFTELMDETAEDTVEIKPIYIQIYNEMLKRDFTARTDIVKAVKDVTLKSLESEMVLVQEYASMLGNSIITKENSGIVRYKLEKLSETSLEKTIISFNEDMDKTKPEGFIAGQGNFFDIHKFVNGPVRYSAGTFRGTYIKDANYMKEQNLFIIDVDEDMTIDEAKALFSNYTYLISTTKSHQIEKNGVVCDRFRIIFPTISKFHLDYETYSKMYMNVINALGIPEADSKCKNASRWYYGNPEGTYEYNTGSDLLDIRPFIPDSAEKMQADASVDKYDEDSEHAPEDTRIDGAIKWVLSNTSRGNRNDNLFQLCMVLKNKIEAQDWQHWVIYANSCLSEPISDRDLKSTIKSAERRHEK